MTIWCILSQNMGTINFFENIFKSTLILAKSSLPPPNELYILNTNGSKDFDIFVK